MSDDGKQLTPSEAMARLEAAVAEARTFFGIDPLYETPVRAEGAGSANARIMISPGYYFRPIGVDLDLYQKRPDKIRGDMAHEVAHLASDELACMFQRMPPDWSKQGEPLAMLLIDAVERLTVRLEKLYLRERPDAQ